MRAKLAFDRPNPKTVKNKNVCVSVCLCVCLHVCACVVDGQREMNEVFSYSRAQIRASNYGIWCCCLSPPGGSN